MTCVCNCATCVSGNFYMHSVTHNVKLHAHIYGVQERRNIKEMNKEVGMVLPQKRGNTSGVGKSNNYYEAST